MLSSAATCVKMRLEAGKGMGVAANNNKWNKNTRKY